MIRNLFCLLFLSHSMSITAKDYVVTDFGAKSDTTVVSTDAVQQCIATVAGASSYLPAST